jgi:hypothetical protein
MDLNFVAYPPIATTPSPTLLENTSIIIQLTFINRNAKHGDPISAVIGTPTVRAPLYQVLDDNVTPGAQITGEALVSNTNHLVYYKPPILSFGANFDSFAYLIVNGESQQSAYTTLPINVTHVDQPIFASPTTFTGDPQSAAIPIHTSVTSADGYPITLTFTNLPQIGYLYAGSLTPEGLVSSTNNSFDPSGTFYFVREHVGECGVTNDTGFPYAVLGYVITNTVGKSATSAITINVPPAPAPPYFTGPTNYVLLENSNLAFTVTGASPQNHSLVLVIESSPQHGTLYSELNPHLPPIITFPFFYPTNLPLLYVPNTNYFGPDSFEADLQDSTGNETCTGTNFGGNHISLTVQEVNLPPSVHGSDQGFTVITEDDSGTIVSILPAVLDATVSDSDALPTDLERITIRALKNGLPSDGQLSLLTTNGLVGLQFTNAVECTFEGTLANINAVLNNQFQYTPTGGSSDADSVVVTINDEGHNGVINNPLQASATLSITYFFQGGSIP